MNKNTPTCNNCIYLMKHTDRETGEKFHGCHSYNDKIYEPKHQGCSDFKNKWKEREK